MRPPLCESPVHSYLTRGKDSEDILYGRSRADHSPVQQLLRYIHPRRNSALCAECTYCQWVSSVPQCRALTRNSILRSTRLCIGRLEQNIGIERSGFGARACVHEHCKQFLSLNEPQLFEIAQALLTWADEWDSVPTPGLIAGQSCELRSSFPVVAWVYSLQCPFLVQLIRIL